MVISVVAIGNSKGIRIPKSVLDQLNITDKIDMEIHNNHILLKPMKEPPRAGWDEAFKDMHQNQDDRLLIPETLDENGFEWEW